MKVSFRNTANGGDEYFEFTDGLYEKMVNADFTVISKRPLTKHTGWERIKMWWEYKKEVKRLKQLLRGERCNQ